MIVVQHVIDSEHKNIFYISISGRFEDFLSLSDPLPLLSIAQRRASTFSSTIFAFKFIFKAVTSRNKATNLRERSATARKERKNVFFDRDEMVIFLLMRLKLTWV